MAMLELLVRGLGWPVYRKEGAMAGQVVWVALRWRKLAAAKVLGSRVHALADLAFPGLTGCFTTGLEAKTLRMLLGHAARPGAGGRDERRGARAARPLPSGARDPAEGGAGHRRAG
ncbi:hypothetical protein [Dactylosporangium sp. CA-233914]|uniref:hypothetical protein n=1 Tax=Dactylosporangium sp. CA-233914 TaxID=3239934 RepID=UPI003D923C07